VGRLADRNQNSYEPDRFNKKALSTYYRCRKMDEKGGQKISIFKKLHDSGDSKFHQRFGTAWTKKA